MVGGSGRGSWRAWLKVTDDTWWWLLGLDGCGFFFFFNCDAQAQVAANSNVSQVLCVSHFCSPC